MTKEALSTTQDHKLQDRQSTSLPSAEGVCTNSIIVPSKELEITYRLITPEVAATMLENALPCATSAYRTRKWIDTMLDGSFSEDSTLHFDYAGRLIKGHHRLRALVRLRETYGFICVSQL